MAGLSYHYGAKGRDGGPKGDRGMGIQFVKSSEIFHSELKSDHALSAQATRGGGEWGNPGRFARSNSGVFGSSSFLRNPSQKYSYDNHFHRSNSVIPNDSDTSEAFCFGQVFGKSDSYSFNSRTAPFRPPGQGNQYKMPGSVNLSKGAQKSMAPLNSYARTPEARPVLSKDEYHALWKAEKDSILQKFRKLAYEVVSLKTDRPNAKDKLHSAANRVPIRIEFNTEPVFGAKKSNSFLCYVFMEGFRVASGQGMKIKDSKTNAYEAALQKILMPHMRMIYLDPETQELQASKGPFTSPPPEPSKVPLNKISSKHVLSSHGATHNPTATNEVASQHKESNMEAACLKRRFNEYKPLEEFVIVEPLIPIPDCTPAHTLRRSADFNHVLLEYDYFFRGEAARCVLKIENQVLADVNGGSKIAAKNNAATQALKKLKDICWVIKTKKAVDSNTKISKEEMLNELNEQSDVISHDNIGNKLLRKMGWSGGGVGKDGSGIAEPVVLKSILNREGLGLSAQKGITDEFKNRVREVIENYASSENQEDLVFSCDFRLNERQIIHDECRRLNLRSKSRGKGQQRYLCVRRKRSANQLFDHIMSCGGETARYVLVPPGSDVTASPPETFVNTKGAGVVRNVATRMDRDTHYRTMNGQKLLMGLPEYHRNEPQDKDGGIFQGNKHRYQGMAHEYRNDKSFSMRHGNGPNIRMQNSGNSSILNFDSFQRIGNQLAVAQGIGGLHVGKQGVRNQWNMLQNMGNRFGIAQDCQLISEGSDLGMGTVMKAGGQNGQMGMQNVSSAPLGRQNLGNNRIGFQPSNGDGQRTDSADHWGSQIGGYRNYSQDLRYNYSMSSQGRRNFHQGQGAMGSYR